MCVSGAPGSCATGPSSDSAYRIGVGATRIVGGAREDDGEPLRGWDDLLRCPHPLHHPRKRWPYGVPLAFRPVNFGRSEYLGQRRGESPGALVWPSDAPRPGGTSWELENGCKRHDATHVEGSKDLSSRRSRSTLTQNVTVLPSGGRSACPRQEMWRDSRGSRIESLSGG